MDTIFIYTVKSGDGFLTIARHIFSQSNRAYIRSLTNRYDLMKEVSGKIEGDLKHEYPDFKLKNKQKIKLHSDPGYYIPRLAVVAQHGTLSQQAKKKSTTTVKNYSYFVIHSTEGNLTDSAIEKYVQDKKKGSGHSFINKKGKIFNLWPYNNPNGWATRSEKSGYKPELRGKLVNIELVYGKNEKPTEEQYQSLASIYLESKELFKKWLPIAAHREIDRGIPGGHKDPIGFDFDYFYKVLKTKKVPIDAIDKQSQARFNQMPWCEHKWVWPPVLSGTAFIKVSDDEFKAKGCK